jgi:hypothetical protein
LSDVGAEKEDVGGFLLRMQQLSGNSHLCFSELASKSHSICTRWNGHVGFIDFFHGIKMTGEACLVYLGSSSAAA